MRNLTIDEIKANGCLLFECVSGSRAYGLATPESDTDIKGVFVWPREMLYGFGGPQQLNGPNNDEVYYELGRFVELLAKNNPNLLEMLAAPEDCVRFKHPLFRRFTPALFLSQLCKDAFAGYANAQIKKARGLNKKIANPMEKTRKGVLDFCRVPRGQGSVPLLEYLNDMDMAPERCGLAAVPRMTELYGLYYGAPGQYKGLTISADANDVALSSIPKSAEPETWVSFNKSGYSRYCRLYREYWDWVETRNEARYRATLAHGKNYDAKNMMHTFRLLRMAAEIAREGELVVRRPDRAFLLGVRSGAYAYEELVDQAEAELAQIDELFAASALPGKPDLARIDALLAETRADFYARQKA